MQYRDIELHERDGEWFFEDGALASTHNPKHSDQVRRSVWMAREDAVECQAQPCLGKVASGKSHNCGPFGDAPLCAAIRARPTWFSHIEMFWIPARHEYVLTSQPYSVSLTEFRKMEMFAKLYGLELSISLADAWWYPGRTPLIVWQRRVD